MPEKLHKELSRRAREMGMVEGSDEYNRYVYGTLKKVEKRMKEKEEADMSEIDIPDPPE